MKLLCASHPSFPSVSYCVLFRTGSGFPPSPDAKHLWQHRRSPPEWRSAGTLCGTAVPFEGTFVRVLLFIIPCFSYFVNYDEALQQIHGECCVRSRISAADVSFDRKAAL